MRLIDADALKEAFKNQECWNVVIAHIIDNATTVEYTFEEAFQKTVCEQRLYCPQRPQDEWITFPTNHSIIQCPECTALINNLRVDVFKDKVGKMNFCPNCGAEMRGGTE